MFQAANLSLPSFLPPILLNASFRRMRCMLHSTDIYASCSIVDSMK